MDQLSLNDKVECSASLTREHQYRSFFNVSIRTKSHHGYSKKNIQTWARIFLDIIVLIIEYSDINDAAYNRSDISLCGDGYDHGKLGFRDITTDQILVKDF